MELREGLELINKICKQVDSCLNCPLSIGESKNYCPIDSIEVGKNIDLICKVVEEAKKQAEKPMTVEDAQVYVMNHLGDRTKLEQLAEEAAELSQAALKLIRASDLCNNPTTITKEQALQNMHEEIIDVLMCARAYNCELECADFADAAENSPKWIRWVERLKGEKK